MVLIGDGSWLFVFSMYGRMHRYRKGDDEHSTAWAACDQIENKDVKAKAQIDVLMGWVNSAQQLAEQEKIKITKSQARRKTV